MRSESSEADNERKKQSLDSLARVLKNGLQTASGRQRRLIQYLATEELEGRGDRLKAVSIATEVLGRSADFDPQTDSIVRVEMGRLRQALDLYYATRGANDPVRIKFERGSYRPKFEWAANGATARPSVRTPKRLWLLITLVLITALASVVVAPQHSARVAVSEQRPHRNFAIRRLYRISHDVIDTLHHIGKCYGIPELLQGGSGVAPIVVRRSRI